MNINLSELIGKASGSEIILPGQTLDDFGLGGVDCKVCGNTGMISKISDGYLYSRECECMKKRRSIRSMKKSGMEDMIARYTFDNYEEPDERRKRIKYKAEKFVESDKGWFFIAGRSGSGKTHICTAICSAMIEKGIEVRYMLWRDESASLKACITDDEEYQSRIRKLKDVSVLYVDDFWKGKISEADINLSFEILNSRYIDSKKRTILSSELTLKEIIDIDEAIGSRIFERSRGYSFLTPNQNWRLTGKEVHV